jgi:uncharacterized membrane protein YjfL (UPF0719 family)
VLAGLKRGVVKKASFSMSGKGIGQNSQFQHGCKEEWSLKPVSAWPEREVVKKASFSMAGKGSAGVATKASFSMSGRQSGQNSQFQHGWKGEWSLQLVSAWLVKGVGKQIISFSIAGKAGSIK